LTLFLYLPALEVNPGPLSGILSLNLYIDVTLQLKHFSNVIIARHSVDIFQNSHLDDLASKTIA
jgi:hypothetical protein